MKRARFACIFVLVGFVALGTIGVQEIRADEKEYIPKAKDLEQQPFDTPLAFRLIVPLRAA